MSNAREIALKIIYKVCEEKAYSNIAFDSEIDKQKINDLDKSFIAQLVYGTLTYKLALDSVILKYSKIKFNKISKWILNILRMGIYQIIYLDKVPKYAIINESVILAKKYGHIASAGFVNAILNKVEKNELDKLKFETDVDKISIITSHEKWFVKKIVDEYGLDIAKKICDSNNEEPPIYVRVNTLKIDINKLIFEFEKNNIKAEKTNINNTLKLNQLFDIRNNELFKKGYFTIQDNAATLAVEILKPKAQEVVLDIAAAPGGKTTHIAEIMNNTGKIIACDIYESRLKLINDATKRLGIDIVETNLNDATKLNDEYLNKFDKVLVDAPCSGFGVIRRKVDIKYQKEEMDISKISNIQYIILLNASKYLKKNGELVYSTCTIFKEENEQVIEKFLKENTNFELIDISKMINNNYCKEKYIKSLPYLTNMDGFFIAKLIKKEK